MSGPRPGPAGPLLPRLEGIAGVKVIGLGGVGSICARYLALFLASREDSDLRLVLVDGDRFEERNAARMLFSRLGNKAEVVREDLLAGLGETRLTLVAAGEYVGPENVARLVREADLVLLCVDNHATRRLVSEHCAGLRDVCLVSGGNDGVGEDSDGRMLRGTYGNVQVQLRRSGRDVTPPLTAFHPEIRDPADRLPGDLSCTELLASVPQILFANLAVASAMLNAVWVHLCGELHYAEVGLDVFDALMRPVPTPGPVAAPLGAAGRAAPPHAAPTGPPA